MTRNKGGNKESREKGKLHATKEIQDLIHQQCHCLWGEIDSEIQGSSTLIHEVSNVMDH